MPKTRKIGLSLGADICWPICYEALLNKLDLDIKYQGDQMRFEVERVTLEPFSLRQPCKYTVVIDRLTHWYHLSREWIKKAVIMDDLYVFNNPWSLQSMEKQTSYCAMMRLGLPVPDTWMIPAKAYPTDGNPDLQVTLERYAKLFDLGEVGKALGYPCFMKPYDGGGWVGVAKIDNEQELHEAYNRSGTKVMNLQQAILPHDYFIRCVGLGPQTRIVNYDPSAPLHDRYRMEINFLSTEDETELRNMTMTINTFFDWDFNSCEALRRDGIWYPIDFANACPDSQVTSLHYHFPWLIKANLRWSIFCAATQRKMHRNLDWRPYYEIADTPDMSAKERLAAYAKIAHKRLETERFEEFCEQHLGHLNELAYEFFGSDTAKDAVRQKVTHLFPKHEIDEFTELFWNRIQKWREQEGQLEGIV